MRSGVASLNLIMYLIVFLVRTDRTSMLSVPALAVSIYTQDLFRQLDSRLPGGDYRIPSLVATTNGTLLAFVNGRMHRTDHTPDIIYMRRSHTDGNTWEEARAILEDPSNRTEFSGAPVVDPATGDVIMLFQRTGARSPDLKPDNNNLTLPTKRRTFSQATLGLSGTGPHLTRSRLRRLRAVGDALVRPRRHLDCSAARQACERHAGGGQLRQLARQRHCASPWAPRRQAARRAAARLL